MLKDLPVDVWINRPCHDGTAAWVAMILTHGILRALPHVIYAA